MAYIGCEGAKYFADASINFSQLIKLDLGWCAIHSEGIKYLCDSFKNMPQLIILKLDTNSIKA
jgi:hypothetical protein